MISTQTSSTTTTKSGYHRSWWNNIICVVTTGCGVLFFVAAASDVVRRTMLRRKLQFQDPKSTETRLVSSHNGDTLSDNYWCSQPDLDPLPFSSCNAKDIVYRIPLHGGMTNALKMVLLAVIKAFEENRCFFIDESQSHLNNFDKVHYYENGFYSRYFERIGLSNEDPRVLKAIAENRTEVLTWKEVWEPGRYRRMYDQRSSIPSLGYQNILGHELKAIMLRRMWRPLPAVRDAACKRMYDLVGHDPYLAMNIRRGDKNTEATFQGYISMETYVSAADEVIREKFPKDLPIIIIFVASDDCTIMTELRSKRPEWKFVSECDTIQSNGFVLSEMQHWTPKDYDDHYGKFLTELFAMYQAKYWIGVACTNVSWFVYFMRGAKLENFWLLDKPKGESLKEALIW